MRTLPSDCVILSTRRGGLLVSRSHATFCGLDEDAVSHVQRVLAGNSVALPRDIECRLEEHGFFGPPREPPPRRRTVSLQLTNACNLRCAYCCTNSLAPRKEELELEQWKTIVDDACTTFGAHVRFAILGGEPLILPWSLDLAQYIASKKDVHLVFYTNGIGFRDPSYAARAAALLRRGFEVRVSLAGASAETCDRQSGRPRFHRVVAGLHEIAKHGSTAFVDLLLFPEDVQDVATCLPKLRKALPRGTHLSIGFPYHGGRESGDRVFQSRSELESAFDTIMLEAGEEIPTPLTAPFTNRRDGCKCALGDSLNVRSDGQLFNCFRMEENVGDVRRRSFGETLITLGKAPRLAKDLDPCNTCALASLCGGGCRTDNLLFNGDPDKPLCGEWRVRTLSELLSEDRVSCLEWSLIQLVGEARDRGIEAPDITRTVQLSRHLRD